MSSRTVSVVIPTFRDVAGAMRACLALARQTVPDRYSLEIIVVDDGSGNGTSDRLESQLSGVATIVPLERNRGRAIARNAGVEASTGELILFTDSDCTPRDSTFLNTHLMRHVERVVATTGPVVGHGIGFWSQYQVRSHQAREAMIKRGVWYAGTTANLMVRRAAFVAVGGFNEKYSGYGFEDRDLLIRIGELGEIVWVDDAVIVHESVLDLSTVCGKLREAGATSAGVFAQDHPVAYRQLGYAGLDANLSVLWRLILTIVRPMTPFLIRVSERLIQRELLPVSWRIGLAKIIQGVSFGLGTCDRKSETPADRTRSSA